MNDIDPVKMPRGGLDVHGHFLRIGERDLRVALANQFAGRLARRSIDKQVAYLWVGVDILAKRILGLIVGKKRMLQISHRGIPGLMADIPRCRKGDKSTLESLGEIFG